ncbi:MAG TPA: DUF881 domain-containing protein [Acidimicrobiales bacterium]|nr:DUF881 domain-containing protein [Acidimicrobiales bacterium]
MTAPLAAAPGLLRRLRAGVARPMLLAVAATVVGFLLVGQLQGQQAERAPLEAESEGDLARILADLNSEADALQGEIAELRIQLSDLRRSSRDETAAAASADEQLRNLQVLAGTTPVTGPGVVMTITDSNGSLTYDALIDVVQELRDAGAEAIAVNDVRIGVATAFAEREGRITVDGAPLTAPYRIAAIGQPATLDGGLKIPGGAVDAVSTIRGVRVDVARRVEVQLPALVRAPRFDAARPAKPSQ